MSKRRRGFPSETKVKQGIGLYWEEYDKPARDPIIVSVEVGRTTILDGWGI